MDEQYRPVIQLKEIYVSESLASRMLGQSIENVRKMIKTGELRGIEGDEGDFSVQSDSIYLTPKTIASLVHVQEQDVLHWINSGKLKATKDGDAFKIAHQEYTRFGQSGEWMPQFHNYAFEYMKKLVSERKIIEEVNDGFRRGMKPHIIKARETIEYLEKIHYSCDPKLDVLKDRSAVVAVYVVAAKLISILYSSLNLIEKSELTGASSLFRTIYEGVDLINYFLLSGNTKNGQKNLKKWLEGDSVKNTTCGSFLVDLCKKNNFDKDGKMKIKRDELYDLYCKLVHLNYPIIMESYNAMASRGFGQLKIHRMGFDYKNTRLMRRAVPFLTAFETLLDSVIVAFLLSERCGLPLKKEHTDELKEYHDYYSKSVVERNKILRKQNPSISRRLLSLFKRISTNFQTHTVTRIN